ncbi:MAG: hypothetical protein ABSB42_17390 [Tepidisphaeraceae bacterium]|jgi:hypothetical protein
MLRFRTLAALACVVPALLFALGCYETEYPLGSADKAAVDPAYVGDFAMADETASVSFDSQNGISSTKTTTDESQSTTIIIRNIDNHLYYVEWGKTKNAKPDRSRMVGYTSDVNGVTFANLRELTDDGSIDKKFLVMRISLSADHAKLSLRNLKEDFFKDKNVNSSDALQTLIAANLENDQMYDGEAVVATRVVPATQSSK